MWFFRDFNEIMHLHEKMGGKKKCLQMEVDFRKAVQMCNLVYVGCKEYPYTWSNIRYNDQHIEEQLDRFLCSKDWGSKFQVSIATNVVNCVFDHCPIVFYFKERYKNSRRVSRSFPRDHYEDMESSYEACKTIVKEE